MQIFRGCVFDTFWERRSYKKSWLKPITARQFAWFGLRQGFARKL